ncbi:unnamed protein product [Adineta ricciae]|uniref:Uncharacterized protein n=1 Tax=Adineta ricciae TaxID=249248 RepID=A0A814JKZ4_ADIRI|nr:unnamed protein product [Adineta ricciae]
MMEFDLNEVFSILDENDEGQIQLRRFVDVANNYYSDAEQLARITKALDPNNTGLINFDQFCQGIAQISSLQGVSLKDVASDLSRRSRENSLAEDSDQRSLNQDGSTTTFNEYDVETDETSNQQNNSKIQPIIKKSNHTNHDTDKNQNSHRNIQSSSPILDSSVFGEEEEFSGVAEPDATSYISEISHIRATTPQRASQLLKRNSLLQSSHPSEENGQILQETVDELQKTVEVLTEQKATTTDRLSKIQSENSDLKSRLLALEDRFHDLEGQQARSTESEHQKYTEYITQKDRSFLQEKEILQSRINAIETELKQTHTANGQMKKDVKDLQKKLENVDNQLQQSQLRCDDLADDNEKLIEQLRLQREELEAQKLANEQLVEQLSFDSSRQMFGHTLTRTENIIKSSEIRIQDLDAQVRALKQENEILKLENEKMKEDAVISGIKEGRGILNDHGSLPWDEQLELLSKDELMSKLREQHLVNNRLREYIERMLSVIIDNSPQLLEVTMNGGVSLASFGMPSSSANDNRKAPLIPSSNDTENKSLPVESLKPTESTSNINGKSNDKYCRLS